MSAEDFPEFDDVRLERGFDYGSRGGPRWQTHKVRVRGGYTQRNADWEHKKGRWQTGQRRILQSEMDYLNDFLNARRGAARLFRFKNWQDFRAENMLFYVGDGSARTVQLTKTYGDSANTYVEPIELPIESEFSMTRTLPGGSAQAFTHYTLDPIGGDVTLNPSVSYQTLTDLSAASADDSFTSPSIDTAQLAVGQIIRTSGFYGAAANGLFKIATIESATKITVTDLDDDPAGLPDEGATSTRSIVRAELILDGSDFAFDSATKTVVRSSGNWGNLIAGESITIAGSTDNDGTLTVASVDSASQITVEEALTDEAEGEEITATRAEVSVSDTDIDVDASGRFASGTVDLSVFLPGAAVTTTGFFQAANNDTFTVEAATANLLTPVEDTAVEEDHQPERLLEDEPNVPGAEFRWTGEFDLPAAFVQDTFEAEFLAYREEDQGPREAIFQLGALEVEHERLKRGAG